MMKMADNPKQIEGLDIAEADDGFIIYIADTDRVHYLNPIAGIVLLLCDGRHSSVAIAELLQHKFGLDEPPLHDVEPILSQFAEEGLLIS